MDAMKQNKVLFVSLALILACSQVTSTMAQGPASPVTVKNAWPEYRGQPVPAVRKGLEASGLVKPGDIFEWGPSPSQSPPFNPGTSQSVWLYTTYDNIVYQIPQRGTWHPNRVDPGWPELVGVKYQDAIAKILAEVIGVTVTYGPTGFVRTLDLRWDRVFVDVGANGLVSLVPKIG